MEKKKQTKEYFAWTSMKYRCLNPKHKAFKDYGGRGIKICKRWANSFPNFLIDMGVAPSPKHTLDRIDNSKGYTPKNCRWGTWKDQSLNKRSTVMVEHDGQIKPLSQWAYDLGIKYSTLRYRYSQGWPNFIKYNHYNRKSHV